MTARGYDCSKILFDEQFLFSGLLCACLAHGFHVSRKTRSFDSKHKGFSSNNSFEPWSYYPCYAITYSRPRRKRRKMRTKMRGRRRRRRRAKLKFSRKVNFVQNENLQTPIWSLRHVNWLKYLMKYDKDSCCSPVIQFPLGCAAVLETSFEYNQVSTSSAGFQYNETSLKLSGTAHRNISTIRWPLKRQCVPDIYQEIYWQQRDAHLYPKKGIIPTGQWGWR